ncbi:MAG: Gfo/Idh/MocA family oxidoreductase [Firmicutes bacterium]|nr:Gfo/Idh/MocA family oxidoreductase [Bacillota bacterium]
MNVALVGAGTMGRVHARAYNHIGDARLVAVVDTDEGKGLDFAKEWGITWFPTLRQCLEASSVDVVDICVPTVFHPELVGQAANAGVHVICEKPLALTLAEGVRMIETCQRAGVHFFVAHVVRFFPEYQEAYRVIQSGRLGHIGTARLMRGGAAPHGWRDWYADPAQSGTLVLDLMIHDFDFLAWSLGPVERIYAKGVSRTANVLEHVLANVRFKSGAIALVEGSWAYPSGFRTAFEFAGTLGVLQHASDAHPPLMVMRRTSTAVPAVAVPDSPLMENPYQRELAHFLACIRGNAEPRVTAEDALYALRVSLAALDSIRSGQAIEVKP